MVVPGKQIRVAIQHGQGSRLQGSFPVNTSLWNVLYTLSPKLLGEFNLQGQTYTLRFSSEKEGSVVFDTPPEGSYWRMPVVTIGKQQFTTVETLRNTSMNSFGPSVLLHVGLVDSNIPMAFIVQIANQGIVDTVTSPSNNNQATAPSIAQANTNTQSSSSAFVDPPHPSVSLYSSSLTHMNLRLKTFNQVLTYLRRLPASSYTSVLTTLKNVLNNATKGERHRWLRVGGVCGCGANNNIKEKLFLNHADGGDGMMIALCAVGWAWVPVDVVHEPQCPRHSNGQDTVETKVDTSVSPITTVPLLGRRKYHARDLLHVSRADCEVFNTTRVKHTDNVDFSYVYLPVVDHELLASAVSIIEMALTTEYDIGVLKSALYDIEQHREQDMLRRPEVNACVKAVLAILNKMQAQDGLVTIDVTDDRFIQRIGRINGAIRVLEFVGIQVLNVTDSGKADGLCKPQQLSRTIALLQQLQQELIPTEDEEENAKVRDIGGVDRRTRVMPRTQRGTITQQSQSAASNANTMTDSNSDLSILSSYLSQFKESTQGVLTGDNRFMSKQESEEWHRQQQPRYVHSLVRVEIDDIAIQGYFDVHETYKEVFAWTQQALNEWYKSRGSPRYRCFDLQVAPTQVLTYTHGIQPNTHTLSEPVMPVFATRLRSQGGVSWAGTSKSNSEVVVPRHVSLKTLGLVPAATLRVRWRERDLKHVPVGDGMMSDDVHTYADHDDDEEDAERGVSRYPSHLPNNNTQFGAGSDDVQQGVVKQSVLSLINPTVPVSMAIPLRVVTPSVQTPTPQNNIPATSSANIDEDGIDLDDLDRRATELMQRGAHGSKAPSWLKRK